MSTYHLHARRVAGPLGSFTEDRTTVAASDSWREVQAMARDLARRGFTVWIYEHGTHVFPTASDLRVITRVDPVPLTTRIGKA